MQTILLRADASPSLGMGHFMRCMALAHALKSEGFVPQFVTRCTAAGLREAAARQGVVLHDAAGEQGGAEDLAALQQAMTSEKAAWVVLDGYGFDAAYQRGVMRSGCNLLVVDDHGHLPGYHCDILLNVNIGAEGRAYVAEPDTRLLLGVEYALLRPEFLDARARVRTGDAAVKRLLVSGGGGGHARLVVENILCAVQDLGAEWEIVVAAGGGEGQYSGLEAFVAQSGGCVRFDYAPDMPGLMDWADMAVTAGGGTCWELAHLGVPFLVFAVADNQVPAARLLGERGVARYLGWHEELDADGIGRALADLAVDGRGREAMSRAAMALVDGKGGQRVAEEIRKAAAVRQS